MILQARPALPARSIADFHRIDPYEDEHARSSHPRRRLASTLPACRCSQAIKRNADHAGERWAWSGSAGHQDARWSTGDRQACVRRRLVSRRSIHLLGSASYRGQLRWKLEHGRGDYPRALRNHRHGARHRPRPHLCYDWIFRFLPDPIGRPRFGLGARADECSGWSAHRPWHRTVRPIARKRVLGGARPVRSLLRCLERQSLLTRFLVHGLHRPRSARPSGQPWGAAIGGPGVTKHTGALIRTSWKIRKYQGPVLLITSAVLDLWQHSHARGSLP